jgi:hypothetical protein
MRYIFSTMLVIAVLLLAFTQKEPMTISGTVMDDHGNPLVNATIKLKGTNISAISDARGMFTIEVQSMDAVLIIEYVGYESREIKVNANKRMQIQLKPAEDSLEEIVVTAQVNEKKKEMANSSSRVSPGKTIRIRGNSAIKAEGESNKYDQSSPRYIRRV